LQLAKDEGESGIPLNTQGKATFNPNLRA